MIRKVLLHKAILSALMSGRKYDIISQNGDRNMRTLVFRNKVRYKNATSLQYSIWKNAPSDNAIRRWLKQFQEIGNVLHRKKAGNAVEHWEENWILLRYLMWYERRICWSCLAFCSIDSINNKTFWLTLSYSFSSFISSFSIWKLYAMKNPTII
jgi:hypothetical protein